MAKIKYLGTAHRRVLKEGEDFGGRLATPLSREVVWDLKENNHTVDTKKVGLSGDAVGLLLEDSNFLDVSNFSVFPVGQAESLWLGRKPSGGTEGEPDNYAGLDEMSKSDLLGFAQSNNLNIDTGGSKSEVLAAVKEALGTS